MNSSRPSNAIKSILLEVGSLHSFIENYFSFRKEKNSKLSLRGWSKRLGYTNPSYLSDVINNKRKVTLVLLEKIFKTHPFDDNEKLFLRNLFFIEKTPNSCKDRQVINNLLRDHWASDQIITDLQDQLSPISLMLLIFMSTKSAMTAVELSSHLKKVVSPLEIEESLQKLESQSLIAINRNGQIELRNNVKDRKIVLAPESYIEILPILNKVFISPKQNKIYNYSLTFNIPTEFHGEANQILFTALEKIMLFEKQHHGVPTKTFQLFSTMFPLEDNS
jgi:hypothetical protein